MLLQCNVSYRWALLAVNLCPLYRLDCNWTWLSSSATMKSDVFDQLGASLRCLCGTPHSVLCMDITQPTPSTHPTGGVLSVLSRDTLLTSAWCGLAQYGETSFILEWTWQLKKHGRDKKESPGLALVSPCDSLETVSRITYFCMSCANFMMHYIRPVNPHESWQSSHGASQ